MFWKTCFDVYHVDVHLYKNVCKKLMARLAQLVERQPFKLVVVGSSPTVGEVLFIFSSA